MTDDDLESMTDSELWQFGEETLGLPVDRRTTREDLIRVIIAASLS